MTKKTFPKLFKYTSKGQPQEWQIIADGDEFYTIEGIVGGKLTQSLPTKCTGKNIGKKNETTPEEQALAEAQAKWQKKVDANYNEVLTDEKNFFEPMLAKEFEKGKIDYKKNRVFVQPKLDGLRADNANNKLMSRNGKPYVACPHLYQNEVRLDGELYNHDFKDDFNKIVSLCKKQKPTDEEIKEASEKVQFWAYDFPEMADQPFSKRYAGLKKHLESIKNDSIKLVPTFEVKSDEEVDEYNMKFLDEGYEGTMVRIDAPYENKRSKTLLKYKEFQDAEFKIVGAEEGTGGRVGTIGFFICEDDKGKRFKSNVKGDFDFLKEIWRDHKDYIGKSATVKYFNLTPEKEDGSGGVPRFPYIIKFNREEYE